MNCAHWPVAVQFVVGEGVDEKKIAHGVANSTAQRSGRDVFCFAHFATIAIILGLKEQSEYSVDKDKCMNKL